MAAFSFFFQNKKLSPLKFKINVSKIKNVKTNSLTNQIKNKTYFKHFLKYS